MSGTSLPVVQAIAYLKRHPSLTREQFYEHWAMNHAPIVTPFFDKIGVIRYQQVHAFGIIRPNRPGSVEETTKAIEFDGIALTLVQSMEELAKALSEDSYYKEVVEPDEDRFLDRAAPGKGIVALFYGPSVQVVNAGYR